VRMFERWTIASALVGCRFVLATNMFLTLATHFSLLAPPASISVSLWSSLLPVMFWTLLFHFFPLVRSPPRIFIALWACFSPDALRIVLAALRPSSGLTPS